MEEANPTKFVEESLKVEEAKRRRREGIVILITALMVAALIFFEVQLPDVTPEYSLGSNIVFFLLINVNIILLGLLVFLVVRNLVKLVVERRRHMLGARLQARLVLAFVGLSLVPSVLLFIIAGGLRPITKIRPTMRFFMRASLAIGSPRKGSSIRRELPS